MNLSKNQKETLYKIRNVLWLLTLEIVALLWRLLELTFNAFISILETALNGAAKGLQLGLTVAIFIAICGLLLVGI